MLSTLRARWKHGGTRESEPYLAIETSGQLIKAIKVQPMGETVLLKDYYVDDVLKTTDPASPEVLERNIKTLLTRFAGNTRDLILVLDDLVCLTQLIRVPLESSHDINNQVRRSVLKSNKLDLDDCLWSIVPVNNGLRGSQPNATSLDALVCAARKKPVEALRASLAEDGFKVRAILFQWPCLIRAFHLFTESVFEQQTVALMHLSHDKFSTALIANGRFVEYRESKLSKLGAGSQSVDMHAEVERYFASCSTKIESPIKCIFGSGDYLGIDLLIQELRQKNRYSRAWNAIKKLPHKLPLPKEELLSIEGPLLNTLVGAVLLHEQQHRHNLQTENQTASTDRLVRLLRPATRPLTATAFVLVAIWIAGRLLLPPALPPAVPVPESVTAGKETLAKIERQLDELVRFSEARINWSPLISELHKAQVPGMQVLQIRASAITVASEPILNENHAGLTASRKRSGELILEARYPGGLGSLEQFIERSKNIAALRRVLNQRQPVRVATVTQAEDSIRTNSVVALQFSFEDKAF